MFLSPISIFKVKSYIKKLDTNKSTKSDCPSIKLIKQSSDVIAPYLTLIFNKCILEGTFPNSLKHAEVVPIYKKGCKSQISNYRPISILSPFSKILERHLYDQIFQFLNTNSLLYKFQYGFRTNSSTNIALSQVCEDLAVRMDNGSIACSVFIDLAKAFDTVDHAILRDKLELYGVRGLPGKLIHDYLSDRTQITVVNGVKSSSERISCGVPQGSILGPLLFLVYMNDLSGCTSCSVRLFADDACIVVDDKNQYKLETTINKELEKVNTWMKLNKLSINYNKTNYIVFTNKRLASSIDVKLEGHRLERVTETKYLGVILSEKLSWSKHINFLKSKLNKASYIISKLRHYVDIKTLQMVYYSLVNSHLSYCITTWGGAPSTMIEPLKVIQRKIIRLMTHSDFQAPTTPLFSQLNILKLEDVYTLNLSLIFHKIHNNKIVGQHHLINIKDIHSHNTRLSHNNNYFTNYQKTNIGLSTYSAAGNKIWSSLSADIKSMSYTGFKNKIKKMLIESYAV